MTLTLLLRGDTGPPTIYDNGELIPLPARTKRILEGISPLIQSQVPDFVNADHPNFVAFLEAYYEWMEIEGNAVERTLLLNDYYDIEKTIDEFVESFEDKYMKNIPRLFETDAEGNLLNRKTLLTRIKDFYAVKGSEKSFEFFFHTFYDSIVEFYYPRVDIIESSGGKWIEKRSIRVTSNNGTTNFNAKGRVVNMIGADGTSVATADIIDVFQFDVYPYTVTEFFLSNIQGDFLAGQSVRVYFDDGSYIEETTFGLFDRFDVTSEGLNYRINDFITILDDTSGIGASAKVSRVDNKGRIKQISILNHGVNYVADSLFAVESETGDGTAKGFARTSAVALYDGFYYDDGGKPSSRKKIHDSDYYQRFSYVLKTNLSLKKYQKALKALIHPAGFKVFGDVLLAETQTSELPFHSQVRREEVSIIANYTPYTFGTTQDLRNNSEDTDLYPDGYAPGYTGVGSNSATNATVPEGGSVAHIVGSGLTGPLGTAGAEGYTAAQELNLDYFPIYHHPNIRGLNTIPSGISFGTMELRPFFYLPVGFDFHSNPTYSTWTSPQFPYLGNTSGGGTHDEYYSVPYGTTSESPND